MPRAIIHLDLDAFYCSVEELCSPGLRGKAFAVGGRPQDRGVVASCSYAARASGVHSAMPMRRALRLCPHLIVVEPHFPLYRRASRAVMERLHAVSPIVQQLSIDEAFLDVSDRAAEVTTIARDLQTRIRDELKLPCSLGVATNKLVAKIATDVGKAERRAGATPTALRVVEPGDEAAFLAPLPASTLWGVGPKTSERLAELGMHTIGDIAVWPVDDLVRRFGQQGHALAQHARGIDDRPLETERVARSISKETTFARDVRDVAMLRRTLAEQAAQVARKLRDEGAGGTTVKLKLRWADFTTLSRQVSLGEPHDDAVQIARVAAQLLDQVWTPGRRVRLIGVGVSGLDARARQLSWLELEEAWPDEQGRGLDAALTPVRECSDDAVGRGNEAELER